MKAGGLILKLAIFAEMALTVRITDLFVKSIKNLIIETNFVIRLKIWICVLILYYNVTQQNQKSLILIIQFKNCFKEYKQNWGSLNF